MKPLVKETVWQASLATANCRP